MRKNSNKVPMLVAVVLMGVVPVQAQEKTLRPQLLPCR